MRPIDRQVVEHRRNVVRRPSLGIFRHIVRHLGRRITPRGIRNRSVPLAEMPHLRFPRAMVAGELMHEYDRNAGAGFLVVQANAVVGAGKWHRSVSPDLLADCMTRMKLTRGPQASPRAPQTSPEGIPNKRVPMKRRPRSIGPRPGGMDNTVDKTRNDLVLCPGIPARSQCFSVLPFRGWIGRPGLLLILSLACCPAAAQQNHPPLRLLILGHDAQPPPAGPPGGVDDAAVPALATPDARRITRAFIGRPIDNALIGRHPRPADRLLRVDRPAVRHDFRSSPGLRRRRPADRRRRGASRPNQRRRKPLVRRPPIPRRNPHPPGRSDRHHRSGRGYQLDQSQPAPAGNDSRCSPATIRPPTI